MVSIRTLEQQLRAVANARRLAILSYLKSNKGAVVADIAAAIRVSMPAASQHLRILKAAGIVEHKKRGLQVTYRLSLKQHSVLHSVLSQL